ncbi:MULTISPECIES: mannose/fructose/sorbose PTS transporter subunit IIB [Tetragenococcus]|uniref:PTS system mannose-specific IIB component n=3 Tax=Tetragenococcus TaxID=51668 RepID=A0A091CDF4_9ENTE|nr:MULTISPECIES: mannose/fructose/sorbose PTS transporter subunit IIB [Tetragenococcus]GMA47652.1 PTS fructose transporter subunit IIB [Tetragenococcus muriaticus]AYW51147.1 PTS fructose transporter subunit IIB [Tetragenococcus halophilus]KFN91988.1 PTS system mannose-specific IIB component [Tetragenococcus muriaticus 3MR10-3]KFN92753.1 PTS system mannose-specific IIB component [Tetragenococcus muriaticus PMC-11-5]GBD64815.1 Mannose/glucose-specific phosphotransferase system enzyme IIB compone
MEIRLARIDDRLIHGQVTTSWTKRTDINRIIVVSDTVAFDHLSKFLLQQAAPPGINANVVTVQRMLEAFNSQLFKTQKVMLLFTNPQDVEKLVRGGIQLKSLNIGGMRFENGKQMITNFVSVNEKDQTSFHFLAKQGIELEVRKVPTDRKVNLIDLLDKKEKAK